MTGTAAQPLAKFTVSERSVEWTPLTDAEGYVLRFAMPDGEVREFTFTEGSSPAIRFDPAAAWPDGVYVYELTPVASADSGSGAPTRQGGFFRIAGGSGLPNDAREGAPRGVRSIHTPAKRTLPKPDQLVGDDLIVPASACVGSSCANGESFGDDTLRLKSNVLQLHIEDTSIGSFPSRDWRLRANDAGNGADYLALEELDPLGTKTPFRLMAGAPTDSLFLSSVGRLGLGTPTPDYRLHVRGDDGTTRIYVEDTLTGGTPERVMLTLKANGKIRFALNNGIAACPGASPPCIWTFDNDGNFLIGDAGDGVVEMTLTPAGNMTILGTLTQNSDVSRKAALEAISATEILEKVAALPISKWSYVEDPEARHIGPTAQDFRAAFDLGSTDTGIASIDADGVALAAVQALYQMVKQENAALRERLEKLEGKPKAAEQEP